MTFVKRLIVLNFMLFSVFAYAQNSNVKEQKELYLNANSLIYKSITKFFSPQGLLIEKSIFNNQNDLIQRIKYNYNTSNQVIIDSSFNREGVMIETNQYQYDSNGNKTKHQIEYSGNNSGLMITYHNKYDQNSNLIEQLETTDKRKEKRSIVYHYNSNNQKTTCSIFLQQNLTQKTTYEYSGDLLFKETEALYDVKTKTLIKENMSIYRYNKQQGLKRKLLYSTTPLAKQVMEFIYLYNKQNNLRRTEVKTNGKVERSIQYSYTYY